MMAIGIALFAYCDSLLMSPLMMTPPKKINDTFIIREGVINPC